LNLVIGIEEEKERLEALPGPGSSKTAGEYSNLGHRKEPFRDIDYCLIWKVNIVSDIEKRTSVTRYTRHFI